MKYVLLALIGAVVLYEIAAQLQEQYARHSEDIHEDARKHRVRVLNQTGMVPGEVV